MVDEDQTAFRPNVASIESIQAEDARAYAAVGAIVLTAAAIDMELLNVATALAALKASTVAKLFNKYRHLDLVDALIDEATPEEKAVWSTLRPHIITAMDGPRHLGAHGHLEVRPVFQFTGVPGPAGTLASTGFEVVGASASLQQHAALVHFLGRKADRLTPEEMLTHLRKQAQALADIRAFEAKLRHSR